MSAGPEDTHRLDRPPEHVVEDPRGQGAGAYSGAAGHDAAGAAGYGRGRGTDFAPGPGSSAVEQPETTVSHADPALADQLGGGSRERSAYGAAANSDFGREGRSIQSPKSQGPLGDRWDEDVPPRDPHEYGPEDAERWRAGNTEPLPATTSARPSRRMRQ